MQFLISLRTIGGMTASAIEDLLREPTPRVLGTLVRRHGQFEGCEGESRAARVRNQTGPRGVDGQKKCYH